MDTYSEAPHDLVVNGEVITPGALVEAKDGPLGRVERVIGDTSGAGPNAGVARSLLVRTPDGQALEVATEAVSRVTPNQPAPIVHLRLTRAFLGLPPVEATQPHAPEPTVRTDTALAAASATAADTANTTDATDTQASDIATGDDISVPLAEERLTTSAQWRERGRAHIRKRVAYEDQRLVTPVTYEEVIVEHIAPERFDADAPLAPDELIIPVLEERLVVHKETVVREYVRVRKQSRERQYQVRGQVRREVVQVDETPDPAFGDTTAPLAHERIVGPTDSAPTAP
jgi:uncharacterized protein (TIGR02271 family)